MSYNEFGAENQIDIAILRISGAYLRRPDEVDVLVCALIYCTATLHLAGALVCPHYSACKMFPQRVKRRAAVRDFGNSANEVIIT